MRSLLKRISLLSVVILTISSCATEKYVPIPLQLPPTTTERPSETSLECLSDETYTIIVKAYKRIETLEALIRTTH